MDFEKLYNTYYMQVYSYIITIVKNSSLAEELTQDVFYKAMKSAASYKGQSNELTWLCAIAKNACMDEFRKNSKISNVNLDTDIEETPSPGSMELDIEDEHMTFRIHEILHDMPEPYKEVFQLRVFGELDFRQIGKLFGKTESWARVTYHRGRIKIQERMMEHGE